MTKMRLPPRSLSLRKFDGPNRIGLNFRIVLLTPGLGSKVLPAAMSTVVFVGV
jgi:hypothetical protein